MLRSFQAQILVLIAMLAAPAAAQYGDVSSAGGPVQIGAMWRFHTGDNPQWAAPNYDDSEWPLLQTGKSWSDQGYPDYFGYAWYRIRVKLPESSAPLGIEIGQIYTSAEVYVDGKLAGTIGRMRPTPQWDFQTGTGVVPLPVTSAGSVEVAVRFWEKPTIAHYRPGGFLERPRIGPLSLLAQADFASRARFFAGHLPDLAVEALAASLALFSLGLFVLRRRATEYAWCGLWLLSYAGSRSGDVVPVLLAAPVSVAQEITNSVLFASMLICCLMFVWRFLGARADILLRTGIALALLLLPEHSLMFTARMTVTIGHILYFVLVAGITVILFMRLIRSSAAGNYEARLLLVPFLLMMGAEDANQVGWVLFTFRVLSFPRLVLSHAGLFTIYWSNLSDLLAMMALGLALVLRFTRSAERDERLSAELDAARRVQSQLVPVSLPPVENLRFDAAYLPAAEVGGDFYQILPQPSGATLLVVGDVSGKGLKAAMTGTLALGTLRSLVVEDLSPAQMLARLNTQLSAASDGGFVTCCAARIEPEGLLTLANAGHMSPYRAGKEIELESGLPLGIAPHAEYLESSIQLAPGDTLTFLSDGVLEARNASGELFGFERTAAISTQSAESIAHAAQSHGQEDDITVLTVTFAPAEVLHA
jgi:phosphoserine phosphatase RsbU/P